jgi:uncharacterized metal-binding protein
MPEVKLSARQRRALDVLAGCPDGCAEVAMIAQGFTIEMLCALVGAGLATAKAVRMVAGGKPVEVTRVYITEAGRAELEP